MGHASIKFYKKKKEELVAGGFKPQTAEALKRGGDFEREQRGGLQGRGGGWPRGGEIEGGSHGKAYRLKGKLEKRTGIIRLLP